MTLTLIVVFGVFQAILFLMHADIHKALMVAFGWQASWLTWLFALLSLTFVSASILAHRFCNPFIKWYYRFSAYWFGLTQFLFGGSVIFFLLAYGFYNSNHYVSPILLGIVSFGSMFLIHSYATWQTSRIKITRVSITRPDGHAAWPQFWRGKKIVFVSDVHLGAALGSGFAKKVAAAIAKESPEMVLIGGDMFDGVRCHSQSLLQPFATLHPSKGIYFASGNHEYIEDTPVLLKEIEAVGIRILKNEAVEVDGLQVAGVDWKDTHKSGEFGKILADMHLDKTKPSILMRHEPNHLEVAANAGVSLTLCGHTHAGQIWPLGLITRQIYKGFDYGLKGLGDMMVFTSSGIGTWGPPLRFGTKSEMAVITLK